MIVCFFRPQGCSLEDFPGNTDIYFKFLLQSDNELLMSEMQKKWGSPDKVGKTSLILKYWCT